MVRKLWALAEGVFVVLVIGVLLGAIYVGTTEVLNYKPVLQTNTCEEPAR